MKERRKLERRHIMFYSRVFDRKTGKLLGYLGNITIQGVMIISEEPITTNSNFKLRLDLPEDLYQKAVLTISGRSLWCRPDIDPNFFNTGFRFEDLSEDDMDIIEKINIDYEMKV